MNILGWKYNISDIQAALLIDQLVRIKENLVKREEIATFYERNLNQLPKIKLLQLPKNSKSARHLFTILVDNRDEVILKFQESGIGVATNYRPIHLLNYYQERYEYKQGDYPIAEEIGEKTISIPLYPRLKQEEIEYIVRFIKSF